MKYNFLFKLFIPVFSLYTLSCPAQIDVPSVYSKIISSDKNGVNLMRSGRNIKAVDIPGGYKLQNMIGSPEGTENGIRFNFNDLHFYGILYYGFIHYSDSRHPLPVYFRSYSEIVGGIAEIDIRNKLSGRYDMIGWEEKGMGTIGYRVVNNYGELIYDGRVAFSGTGPFKVANTIIEGPFVTLPSPASVTIVFKTNEKLKSIVIADNREFTEKSPVREHEITITGLEPDYEYEYTIRYDEMQQTYSFHTFPAPGSRKPFVFAYTSDCRNGQGGGERGFYGVNAYIMKKIMAVATQYNSRFLLCTGDLVDGYLTDKDQINLQYANWKKSVEAFAHYMPVFPGMGNHETLNYLFYDTLTDSQITIDRFPFETESSESVFRNNFCLPLNGPESEDGTNYDPDPLTTDFPSYKESVYYFTCDNVGIVMLNSDYWYAPTLAGYPHTSGNLHGYIMDKQFEWLEQIVQMFESDINIDHIFVTQHTPAFPNGGHVADDMWYNGRNEFRPFVAGKPVGKGIIERRDDLLNLLANRSSKFVALLTGDEHNYNRMTITDSTKIYPEPYYFPKISISRPVYQINNGAAGAPYYAQERTPWSDIVEGFTTQNAVVFIYVDGKKVWIEVINPDTLEKIDETLLKE